MTRWMNQWTNSPQYSNHLHWLLQTWSICLFQVNFPSIISPKNFVDEAWISSILFINILVSSFIYVLFLLQNNITFHLWILRVSLFIRNHLEIENDIRSEPLCHDVKTFALTTWTTLSYQKYKLPESIVFFFQRVNVFHKYQFRSYQSKKSFKNHLNVNSGLFT